MLLGILVFLRFSGLMHYHILLKRPAQNQRCLFFIESLNEAFYKSRVLVKSVSRCSIYCGQFDCSLTYYRNLSRNLRRTYHNVVQHKLSCKY